ncbi:MAG TPA: hypothetical protein VK762_05095 [Polyangiaceae bacterium]|nr:hypothetical protein [Polyangiaceae bacterium]
MLYRKLPPRPPRLLLRIVATAGTGALLGVVACGTDSTTFNGTIASPGPDATRAPPADDASIGMGGFLGMAAGSVDASVLDDTGGDATDGARLDDASPVEDSGEDEGSDQTQDASDDAQVSDGAIKDAADEGNVLHCPPICGVVVHP